jgi:hypothetical protein
MVADINTLSLSRVVNQNITNKHTGMRTGMYTNTRNVLYGEPQYGLCLSLSHLCAQDGLTALHETLCERNETRHRFMLLLFQFLSSAT